MGRKTHFSFMKYLLQIVTMKKSHFRKLIREEIRNVLKEVNSIKTYDKEAKILIYKKDKDRNARYIAVMSNNSTSGDYVGLDNLFDKVPGTSENNFVVLFKIDKNAINTLTARGNQLPEVGSAEQVGTDEVSEDGYLLVNPSDIEIDENIQGLNEGVAGAIIGYLAGVLADMFIKKSGGSKPEKSKIEKDFENKLKVKYNTDPEFKAMVDKIKAGTEFY